MNADWTQILKLVSEAAGRAIIAYTEARRLAQQNGVTDAEIDAATAAYTTHTEDPLAGAPPTTPPTPPEQTAEDIFYARVFDDPMDDDETILAAGYKVGDQAMVSRYGPKWAVSRPDKKDHPDFKRHHVIGG